MLEIQPFLSSLSSVFFFSCLSCNRRVTLCLVFTSAQKTLPDSLWNQSVSFLARVSFLSDLQASEMKLKFAFSEDIFFSHSQGNLSLRLLRDDWHSERSKTNIL